MKVFTSCLALASLAALAAGCKNNDNPIVAPTVPMAHVRFVDAVPDSGAMDWHFVDDIYNSPSTFAMNFRGTWPGARYQALGAGSRHLTVFQSGNASNFTLNTPAIVSQVEFDTTYTFAANTNYTILIAGSMRNKTAKMYILTDDFTDPGTSVELRVVNAGVGSVDVYGGSGSTLPSSPIVGGVADYSASKYVTMASSSALNLMVVPSGTTSLPAMINAAVPTGAAADQPNDLTAVGGIAQPGSVLTVFLMPASVAGSTASSFKSAGAVYIVDKDPPSGF